MMLQLPLFVLLGLVVRSDAFTSNQPSSALRTASFSAEASVARACNSALFAKKKKAKKAADDDDDEEKEDQENLEIFRRQLEKGWQHQRQQDPTQGPMMGPPPGWMGPPQGHMMGPPPPRMGPQGRPEWGLLGPPSHMRGGMGAHQGNQMAPRPPQNAFQAPPTNLVGPPVYENPPQGPLYPQHGSHMPPPSQASRHIDIAPPPQNGISKKDTFAQRTKDWSAKKIDFGELARQEQEDWIRKDFDIQGPPPMGHMDSRWMEQQEQMHRMTPPPHHMPPPFHQGPPNVHPMDHSWIDRHHIRPDVSDWIDQRHQQDHQEYRSFGHHDSQDFMMRNGQFEPLHRPEISEQRRFLQDEDVWDAYDEEGHNFYGSYNPGFGGPSGGLGPNLNY